MTNSFVNFVAGSSVQPEPEVGMGATILCWTDRQAATVVERPTPKTIVVQYDHAKRVDGNGMSDAQTYEYTPNTDGHKVTFTQRKNGAWVRKGEPLKGGQRVALGYRNHYHDFSF